MESLKECWERAELLLETARQRPNKIRVVSPNSSTKWKSIHQKLADLYVEECNREPKQKNLRNASHLLDKLVARDKMNCLLVNLYPGNEGYSVMIKGRSGADTETVRLPYEEAELLQYIDNEELPPVLVDILECSQVNIFYSGCVIAEVRDYRRSASLTIYESHHVLLRPTMQTLICDVNAMTSDSSKWTNEDKMALESHLLLATQEPLCLDPSVTVSLVANYLQYSRNKYGAPPIKQMAKKFSQAAINRKWKFEQHAAPPNLNLYDFVAKRKNKKRTQPAVNLRLGKPGLNFWKQREVKLTPPEELDVAMYAISIPPPVVSGNNIEFVEEYILETKQGNGKGYYCRLAINQRLLDDAYVGELYTDRDYVEGVPGGGSCWFEFLTKANVNKYLYQFIDIFVQESRKLVTISHKVKDEETTVRTIPGGQSIVFPLSSAASMAFQMGELASPAVKRLPSFSKPLTSPTASTGSATNTTDHSGSVITASAISPGVSSHGSSRAASMQGNTGQRPPSRPSSASPGPVVSSPGLSVGSQQKTNPTHVANSRTPTPTLQSLKPAPTPTPPPAALTPISTPSPPNQISNIRRSSQASDVVPSIGLIGRLQSSLAGFLNSGSSEAGTTLAPVSLAGVAVPQGIAVPISLAMVASNQPSLMTTPTGVIVSPLPNMVSAPVPLTGGPISPSTVAVTNTVPATTIMVTSAMLSSPVSSVLTAPNGVVSFPVGLTGSLSAQNLTARLIASGLKAPSVGIQQSGSSSLGLLQVTGSHAATGQFFTSGSSQRPVIPKIASTSSSHSITSITHSSTVTTLPLSSLPSVGPTLMTFSAQQQLHLALQQNQQLASLQLQQLRQQGSSGGGTQKGKGRKRGATTPPN